MTINQDVLKSEKPVYIELFKIDLSKTNEAGLAGSILYLTPMTDVSTAPINYLQSQTNLQLNAQTGEALTTVGSLANSQISFGGNTYSPFPLQITGIESSSEGAPARPALGISNISKYIGNLVFAYNDLIGAEVIYIRTFSSYLGTAQEVSMPPMRFQIAKKTSHNKLAINFELRQFNDRERAYMPKRQMLKKDFPGLGINKNVR